MEQIYVQTEDLSVGYHGKVLLSDIALKVKKGEILVLIGPNGAGKSTIIKNIIREMNPIGGNIYVKGRKISDFTSKEYAKTMSVVLTEKIKTEMMTCRDVVAMGRYPYTNYFGRLTKEDEVIVNESLKKVSALDIAENDFSSLSGKGWVISGVVSSRAALTARKNKCSQPCKIHFTTPPEKSQRSKKHGAAR